MVRPCPFFHRPTCDHGVHPVVASADGFRDQPLRCIEQNFFDFRDDFSQARRSANPFVHRLSGNPNKPGCCGWLTVSVAECGFDLRDAMLIDHFVKIRQRKYEARPRTTHDQRELGGL